MRDIDGIEEVIARIKPHWATIEEHFNDKNEEFKRISAQQNHDTLGMVLKCHLIVEHYLDGFLQTHYGINEIEKIKLSFAQKAKLLPDRANAVAFIKLGIINLNQLRNKFSHQLNYNFENDDLAEINNVLSVARRGETLSPIESIEAFTIIACAFLVIPPPNIQNIFMEAFSSIVINKRAED